MRAKEEKKGGKTLRLGNKDLIKEKNIYQEQRDLPGKSEVRESKGIEAKNRKLSFSTKVISITRKKAAVLSFCEGSDGCKLRALRSCLRPQN